MGGSTESPGTTSWPEAEKNVLITYDVICTILTITLNSVVIAVVLFKVHMSYSLTNEQTDKRQADNPLLSQVKLKETPSIYPVLAASIIGLVHGLWPNLISTISFISWAHPGAMVWCNVSEVLHGHIVFSMILCSTVVSVEVS